jgi:hypothetical protein
LTPAVRGTDGNSEADDKDDGPGAMEAIYFGNAHWGGCHPLPCKDGQPHGGNTGAGPTGPWVGADLESGMYYGGGEQTTVNNRSQALTSPFVSLHLKGRTDGFVLKGGDASKGDFETMYDGPRPKPWTKGRHPGSYQPMCALHPMMSCNA